MNKKSDAKSDDEPYEEVDDELYRPVLIHPSTYMILTEQILTLMPQQRNVVLSMNEYDIKEINPAHPDNNPESPTHVIIFCIRFIADDIFQPIGGLLTYKHHNQCAVLAECLKAYISDLWKLGLYVVATVSPSFKIFKGMISHLVNVEDFDSYCDVISYAVHPIKEIIHIYDIQFLLIKLQTLFKEGNVIFDEEGVTEKRVFEASWTDMLTIFGMYREFRVLAEFLINNEEVSRRVHIFTEQIFNCFLEAQSHELLSPKAEGCAILLSCVRSFLEFTERDFVELEKTDHEDNWNHLIGMLKTLTFQKSGNWTCTKEKPSHVHSMVDNSVRKKIDFSIDYLDEACGQTQETAEQKSTRKSRSRKKKKKKCVETKMEPRRKCQISEGEKLQSLAKIEELCTLLRETNCSEEATESEEFEQTLNVSEELHEADDFENQAWGIETNCDTDKNNTSDENISDKYNKCLSESRSPVEKKIENEMENYLPTNISLLETAELTDNSSNKICDILPNIINYLENNVENKQDKPPDFPEIVYDKNPVTNEMLCTILGMKKLIKLLRKRRLKFAKPDAFIIEHIDYLVKKIQEKNLLKSVKYYGHNYHFMNTSLAFATLNNTKGLYLIAKD